MWRRGIGVVRGSGDGGCYYPGKRELAVLWSLLLGCGSTRPASAEGWVADAVNLQPSRSIAVAVGSAWATRPEHGCVPLSARSAVPRIGRLFAKPSSPSRRGCVVTPDEKDDEKGKVEAQVPLGAGVRVENRLETGLEEGSVAEPEPEEWEEEDNAEPQIGDGGDGGGIVLGDVGWGERALSIANEVLRLHFDDNTQMFAFRVSPRGYIYVRLDKLSNQYGCPTMEEIEKFSMLYNERLEESGESGEVPKDLAFEVSSPGAERLLKVPGDLDRFKDMPMVVHYVEEDPKSRQSELKKGVFLLETIDDEARECVWKLADVRENRDPVSKGRTLSRKCRDWRLRVSVEMLNRVMLYVPLS